jgi:hypothetical protein
VPGVGERDRAECSDSRRLRRLRAAALRGVRGGRVPVAGAPELHGVSGGLGHVRVHEREQRAALPLPAGLRERVGAVRGVPGGVLQGGVGKCLLHALRGALGHAGGRERERERVRVRPRLLEAELSRAARAAFARGPRAALRAVRTRLVQAHAGGRGVLGMSRGPLLPGRLGRADGVPGQQLGGAGARGGRGVPLPRGVPLRAGCRGRVLLPALRPGLLQPAREPVGVRGVSGGHLQSRRGRALRRAVSSLRPERGGAPRVLRAHGLRLQPRLRRGARRSLHRLRAGHLPRKQRQLYLRGVPS